MFLRQYPYRHVSRALRGIFAFRIRWQIFTAESNVSKTVEFSYVSGDRLAMVSFIGLFGALISFFLLKIHHFLLVG